MEISALYLPQFHVIPENNLWWGEGFTEWTNVKKAVPLFKGHQQPVEPGELGYYNLLDSDIRTQQAALAEKFGITSFCYWHYWFGDGKTLLERPIKEVLESNSPTFPYYFGWANHTWSGTWVGAPDRILIEQKYPGEADDRAHFDYLLPYFSDNRYVKVDGKPIMLIFDPGSIPNPFEFTKTWNEMARNAGFPGMYLIAWLQGKSGFVRYRSHKKDGYSAGLYVNFPLQNNLITIIRDILRKRWSRFGPGRYSYTQTLPKPFRKIKGVVHQSVQPNWDNTPRSGRRGFVIKNATPAAFKNLLIRALNREESNNKQFKLIMIKSWNEWAEGNYLEPDLIHGIEYLAAIRDALELHNPSKN